MSAQPARMARKAFDLTTREREVMALRADGLSYREIATRLGVSKTAVEQHAYHARQKLDALAQDASAR